MNTQGLLRRQFYNSPLWDKYVADFVLELATLGGRFDISNREIALRLDGNIPYIRNVIYESKEQLVQMIRDKLPLSIEFGSIGPAYRKRTEECKVVRKHEKDMCGKGLSSNIGELLIDVDMCSSYNRVGVCACPDTHTVCQSCWFAFLEPAQAVIHWILTRQWGFSKFAFVYSGRRGMHCWILDERAIMWTTTQRRAFMEQVLACKTTLNQELFEEVLKPMMRDREPVKRRFVAGSDYKKFCYDELFPRLDRVVTEDPRHLHKLPLCLNPNSDFLCIVMPHWGSKFKFNLETMGKIQLEDISENHLVGCARLFSRLLLVE